MKTRWFAYGAIAMALMVAAGAFGAHALQARLEPEPLGWWNTAAQYHALHAIGLLAVGWLTEHRAPSRALSVAGWGMLVGLVLFCGSLYTMALTDLRWLGAVTPLGGTSWIVAWIALALATRRSSVPS